MASGTRSKSLLFSFDHYRIGGRETYVAAYAKLLRSRGYEPHLVAGTIANPECQQIFSSSCSLSRDPAGGLSDEHQMIQGLRKGLEYIEHIKPGLIWVQHYSILPGMLWSAISGIPILVTLHGPVLGVGRIRDRADILGMAQLLSGTKPVSVVSPEIRDQLCGLGVSPERVILAPNAIERSRFASESPVPGSPVRCVMLARQQKLAHIRAGIQVFSEIRRRAPGARLRLHTGTRFDGPPRRALPDRGPALTGILGRKWLLRHPDVWTSLRSVEPRPLTSNPMQAIDDSDIVLGMGRVLLEAISSRKLPVLIGYRQPVSLVTSDNLASLGHGNFSGRGLPATAARDLADEVALALLQDRRKEATRLQNRIALEHRGADLFRTIDRICGGSTPLAVEPICDEPSRRGLRNLALELLRQDLSPSEFLAAMEADLNETGSVLTALLEGTA